jgi:hypothetical protein
VSILSLVVAEPRALPGCAKHSNQSKISGNGRGWNSSGRIALLLSTDTLRIGTARELRYAIGMVVACLTASAGDTEDFPC